MEKKYKGFAPFNDHGNCKGHGNFMLDSTYESEGDRQSVILALKSYQESKNTETKK